MFGLPGEAVGAIVAATIAGFVAFFSLIITKEQTVSSFRQQWIDALREDISAVSAYASGIHGASIVKRNSGQELWDSVKEDFAGLNLVLAKIRLRLNPDEKKKKEREATLTVLETLKDLESIFSSANPQFHRLDALVITLVSAAHVILKENWKRVRSGEPVYQITKWVALGLTVAFVIALLLHMFKLI
jgi:hypothetical protein